MILITEKIVDYLKKFHFVELEILNKGSAASALVFKDALYMAAMFSAKENEDLDKIRKL